MKRALLALTLASAVGTSAIALASVEERTVHTVRIFVDGVEIGIVDLDTGQHSLGIEIDGSYGETLFFDVPGAIGDPPPPPTTEAPPASPTTLPASGTVTPTTSPTTTTTTSAAPQTTTTTTVATTTTTTIETSGPRHIVIESDTMLTNETMVLRPGDVLELRNGARLMFGPGATADWQGSPTSTWSWDGVNPNTVRTNLVRDVKVIGEGHVMFMAGSKPATIRFVEIDVRPKRELGHYPLHWHLVGDDSRGTLVEGVVIKNSPNRAYVPHGSHGITFKDTIAKNIAGSAYWWDPPEFQSKDRTNNSNDIRFDHALADSVTNAVGDSRGFRLSAFELGAGVGNAVVNSLALNVTPSHAKDCAGFIWPEIHHAQPLTWTFRDNASFGSACNGIFVWQNNSQPHLIDGYRGDRIDHGAYGNFYEYRDVDVVAVEIHAGGWTMTDSTVRELIAFRHQSSTDIIEPVVFTNVAIDTFTINNANNGGDVKGHYVFHGSSLSCDDVVAASVVPGTIVEIDGERCEL